MRARDPKRPFTLGLVVVCNADFLVVRFPAQSDSHDPLRLLGTMSACCAAFHAIRSSQSEPQPKSAWGTASGALTMPEGDPNGECQITKLYEIVNLMAKKSGTIAQTRRRI